VSILEKEEIRMEVYEKKMGRVFRLEFAKGENILAELSDFARKKGIKEASLSVAGAIGEGEIVTGFLSTKEGDSNVKRLGQKREFLGVGNLTWPAKKPSSMRRLAIPWDEPQPYPHLHLVFGPDVGKEQKEILVGHLEKGVVDPAITVLLYELL